MFFAKRRSGVFLALSSLPGPFGIGDIGSDSHLWIDWLSKAGVSIWQILPFYPPGYGESPYSALSSFGGNPMLISPLSLVDEGLLRPEQLEVLKTADPSRIQYSLVKHEKHRLLYEAYQQWLIVATSEERDFFRDFCANEGFWLADFSLFMTLKLHFKSPWYQWPEEFRDKDPQAVNETRRTLSNNLEFICWTQMIFFRQWEKLKNYAKERSIDILGDLPLFVALDSADTWANRGIMKLSPSGMPLKVAGVPPDFFSVTGQRWGNPVYDWDALRSQGFEWWRNRISHTLRHVDMLRIDHFRGLSACWEIDAYQPDARIGEWMPAAGREMLKRIREDCGILPLIAEDLGYITPDVEKLRVEFNIPGMAVVQFAWDGNPTNPHLPSNVDVGRVYYTGTHDNNTLLGWWNRLAGSPTATLIEKTFGVSALRVPQALLEAVHSSAATITMVPLQDVLGLGEDALMNVPGQAEGCWTWRVSPNLLTQEKSDQYRNFLNRYGRAM